MCKTSKDNRLLLYKSIKENLNSYDMNDIENAVMIYAINNHTLTEKYYSEETMQVISLLKSFRLSRDIESVI